MTYVVRLYDSSPRISNKYYCVLLMVSNEKITLKCHNRLQVTTPESRGFSRYAEEVALWSFATCP